MIGHRCKNCTWWDNEHRAAMNIPIEMKKTQPGFCRKHKPGSLRIGAYFYGVQPVTDGDDFCGEFREDES
jgi:hypothetical protein